VSRDARGECAVTTFQHPNGYRVEGSGRWWLSGGAVRPPERDVHELLLDHLIESDEERAAAAIPLALRIGWRRRRKPAGGARYAIGAWSVPCWASEEGMHLGRLGPGTPWLRT
jgi:hypothetical protein